jgi:adenine-specific DNA-methyltransferase
MAATINIDHADVLEYLKRLPDDSVDLIVADPPYFIGFDGGKGWDSQWKTENDYLAWCRAWTAECVRVLKPGRMLVVWGTLKTDTFLRYKLDILNTETALTAQNEIIWAYNWGGRSKVNFARKHEYAWCYSKGRQFLFNADDIRIPRKVLKNLRTGLPHEKGTIPTLIWTENNHTTSKDFVNWHPTTKNLTVLERIIKAYTNEGDTVLDPFMGSGSTAVAAYRAGRSVIGCELDDEYFEKLHARLAKEQGPHT